MNYAGDEKDNPIIFQCRVNPDRVIKHKVAYDYPNQKGDRQKCDPNKKDQPDDENLVENYWHVEDVRDIIPYRLVIKDK